MVTTYIEPEQVILNDIIRHISIGFNYETIDTELRIGISEEDLLKAANRIVEVLPEAIKAYSGKDSTPKIDKVHIRIGEHSIKARWKTVTKAVQQDIGFVKE